MGIGEAGEKLRRSTVQVRCLQDRRGGSSDFSSSGSGVVWDAAGTIVTNAHVVRDQDLTVELWDGRTGKARLDRRDNRRDLAVLRLDSGAVNAGTLHPARAGDSGRLRVGEIVIAVGNPLGFTGALSTGVVHGFGPIHGMGGQEFIQTTARLAPGNSGGPLADVSGNVIGINTMVVSGGLGLAVPISAVRRLLTFGPPVELGVTLRQVGIPGPAPGIALMVLAIAPGSAAEYASLRVGDLLLGSGGRRFTSVDEFREALDEGARAGRITVQFHRGGDRNHREVTVRLVHAAAA
jgi:serine protease Do